MISIKTLLDKGIYRSSGGGETRTHYTYATGPRNLRKAITQLREHKGSMLRSYGNVGCGGSWLEIDGVRIDPFDLQEVETQADAALLISWVQSGRYAMMVSARQRAMRSYWETL